MRLERVLRIRCLPLMPAKVRKASLTLRAVGYKAHIGLQYDDTAAHGVARGILVGLGVTEVILGKYFIDVDSGSSAIPIRLSLHSLCTHGG
jgi:hypothetical protein